MSIKKLKEKIQKLQLKLDKKIKRKKYLKRKKCKHKNTSPYNNGWCCNDCNYFEYSGM